jgi:hypothetical protein
MCKIISKISMIVLFVFIFDNYSTAQKTSLSIQGGFLYASNHNATFNHGKSSYIGTISLFYNITDKIDLMTKIRYYSFIYDSEIMYSRILNYYGVGYFLGCRFYMSKHISEQSSNIFYPYFEIFPGLLTRYSKIHYISDIDGSESINRDSYCNMSYFNLSLGTLLNLSKGICLDINIDNIGFTSNYSGNVGLLIKL